MSEEIKEVKSGDCFYKSREFKRFLTVALGSFVGVYCAISLFAALHRPPMMHPCPHRMMHHHAMKFDGARHHKFRHYREMKNLPPKNFDEKKAPIQKDADD